MDSREAKHGWQLKRDKIHCTVTCVLGRHELVHQQKMEQKTDRQTDRQMKVIVRFPQKISLIGCQE